MRKHCRCVSAGPWGARTTRLRRPRTRRSSIGTPRVHRIPLHVRDDRDTPLFSVAERCEQTLNSVKTKDKYFRLEHWTPQIGLNEQVKFDLSRMRLLPVGNGPRPATKQEFDRFLPDGRISCREEQLPQSEAYLFCPEPEV
jgi:hypothetical protein